MTRMWWNCTSNCPTTTSTGLQIRIADRSLLRLTRAGALLPVNHCHVDTRSEASPSTSCPLLVESASRPAQVVDHATNSLPNRHPNIRMTTLFVTSHRARRLQQVGQYRYACLDKVAWNSTSVWSIVSRSSQHANRPTVSCFTRLLQRALCNTAATTIDCNAAIRSANRCSIVTALT